MNKPTAASREALWSAISANDLAALMHAIEAGANPNSAYGKWTPLGKALREGHLELAHALIDAGADVQEEDQGVPMIDLVCGRHNCEATLKKLLAAGAPTSNKSVLKAASSGKGAQVDLLIAAGAAVSSEQADMPHRRWNALGAWPPTASTAPSTVLMDATFTPHLSEDVARDICRECARGKNMGLLNAILEHRSVSPQTINSLLVQCLILKWKEGMMATLDHPQCTPAGLNPRETSPITAIAQNFRSVKDRAYTIEMLDIVGAHGYCPGIMHEELVPHGSLREYAPIPTWMHAVNCLGYPTHKPLIEALVERGANLNDRFGNNGRIYAKGSLLHFFISRGESDMVGWLLKKYPGVAWEAEGDPGLIATWASGASMERALEVFDALLSFGFDASRTDAYGNSALRNLLDRSVHSAFLQTARRIDDTLLETLGERFVQNGLDLSKINKSETDLQYARKIGAPEDMISKWELASLQVATQMAPDSHKRIRL